MEQRGGDGGSASWLNKELLWLPLPPLWISFPQSEVRHTFSSSMSLPNKNGCFHHHSTQTLNSHKCRDEPLCGQLKSLCGTMSMLVFRRRVNFYFGPSTFFCTPHADHWKSVFFQQQSGTLKCQICVTEKNHDL